MKRLVSSLLLASLLICPAADLTLGWTASPTVDETLHYNVYMAVGGTGPLVLYGMTTDLSIVITNLTPGVYRFVVTAENMWGESIPSNEIKTPAGKPGAVVLQILP